MRSTQDPIMGLRQKVLEWGVVSEDELGSLDREAKEYVDKEVLEAEASPEPEAIPKILYEDIYVPGSEPQFTRGRVAEENYYY